MYVLIWEIQTNTFSIVMTFIYCDDTVTRIQIVNVTECNNNKSKKKKSNRINKCVLQQ